MHTYLNPASVTKNPNFSHGVVVDLNRPFRSSSSRILEPMCCWSAVWLQDPAGRDGVGSPPVWRAARWSEVSWRYS